MSAAVVREAVRAIVLDPADRILLVRFVSLDGRSAWWATPGGGLEDGEEAEAGLRRELREEAGLEEFDAGPVVWTRRHVFDWDGRTFDQRERYVLVRTPAFEPSPTLDLAAEAVDEQRWWTLAELRSSAEVFAPRRLPELLARLLTDGPPADPIDAGV